MVGLDQKVWFGLVSLLYQVRIDKFGLVGLIWKVLFGLVGLVW